MPKQRQKVTRPTTAERKKGGAKSSKERKTIIMFADIIGASEVSNHKDIQSYYEFVEVYQKLFIETCLKYINIYMEGENYYCIRSYGDEGLLMIFPPDDSEELGQYVDLFLHIAFELKRCWLRVPENDARINNGRLPIDIGVGIHVGPTWVAKVKQVPDPKLNPSLSEPEGYSINLAKRVESQTRKGKYTNVMLSDAAFGAWKNHPDEHVFFFDEPSVIQPKGISQNIPIFEVKHFFLSTDWKERKKSYRDKSLLTTSEIDIDLLRTLHKLNPNNLWYSEELIRSLMLVQHAELTKTKDQDNPEELLKKYSEPMKIANNLASSDHRDNGVLLIQGFLFGEIGEYEEERKRYLEALEISKTNPEIYWYLALSFSFDVLDEIEGSRSIKFEDLNEVCHDKILDSVRYFREAISRSGVSAWMFYDYGCELSRWGGKKGNEIGSHSEALDKIVTAHSRLPEEVSEAIKFEQYLLPLKDDKRMKAMLDS